MSPRGGGGGFSRPIVGKVYTRNGEDGDLEEVSTQAYGSTSGTPMLLAANARPTGATKIRKGEKIIIPGRRPAPVLTGKSPDDLTVIVDGVALPMLSCRIIRTMDTCADAWVGRIAWTPGADPRVDAATKPYGYQSCAAYIGNELQIAGCLYVVSPSLDEHGRIVDLTGYSYTADAIDSHVLPPLERSGVTLKQVAEAPGMAPALGLDVHFDGGDWYRGAFSKVCANEGETIFGFLSRLAAQKGGLLSNTRHGDMLFLRANTSQHPVGTLEEGKPPVLEWRAHYDGRKRFYAYRCITAGVKGRAKPQAMLLASNAPVTTGAAPKVKAPTVIDYDYGVPRSRFQTFFADDVTPGNVANAARWKRNKQFADALTQQVPVSGWYAPNGKLWDVNTLVTVISPTLHVPDGFTFLIRSVEFEYTAKHGRTTTLHIIPPQAYTGKEIGDVWT